MRWQVLSAGFTNQGFGKAYIGNLSYAAPGYPAFGNRKSPSASLTGGTQFVTVNQSFTITFGLAKFCRR
jgi:hypothetical protein